MSSIPLNPDVSAGQFEPGIFLSISTAPAGASGGQVPQVLVLGPAILAGAVMTGSTYSLTPGTASANEIAPRYDLADIARAYNRRSPLAQALRSALQEVPVGTTIFGAAAPEPSASGYNGVASALITVGGTAVGSGVVRGWLCGWPFDFVVSNGDTAATIAANLKAAIDQKTPDAPMVTNSIISSVTVPLAFSVRSEVGNERPIVLAVPSTISGVTFSPGEITITTNAVGDPLGASSFTLTCGTQSLSVAIAPGQTPTQQATTIAAAINAATFPLKASAALGVVTLLYGNGWVVHRITVASTEDAAGSTYTLADRQDHGAPPSIATIATTPGNTAATGLQGVGIPTLTTLLANRAKGDGVNNVYSEWFSEYSDSTSCAAIYNHVEQYAGGGLGAQQGQRVMFASSLGVETAKSIISAPSPALSNSWRYAVALSQDMVSRTANAGAALAARLAEKPLPFNVDGLALRGGAQPLYPPRAETDLDPVARDVAMRNYFLTPLTGSNGQVRVVRGVTTWSGGGSNDRTWSDFSFGRLFDDARYRLRNFLNSRFSGKVLFDVGVSVRIDNGFTTEDVRTAVIEWLESRDGITINGARFLARLVQVGVDGDQINIAVKINVPREIHKVSGVLSRAS